MWGYRCCYDFSQHLEGFSTNNWATVTQQQSPTSLRLVLSTSVNANKRKVGGGKTNHRPRTNYSKLDRCSVLRCSPYGITESVQLWGRIVHQSRPIHVNNPHRVVLWSHLQYDGHLEPGGVNKRTSPKSTRLSVCARHQKQQLNSWGKTLVTSHSSWSATCLTEMLLSRDLLFFYLFPVDH